MQIVCPYGWKTVAELAGILGVPQSNIAFWEQSEKPPRSDVLPAMAQAFGVRLEELLKVEAEKRTPAKKKNGPTARVREVFDRVSKLPRRQQEKIVEFVSVFVTQYEQKKTYSLFDELLVRTIGS